MTREEIFAELNVIFRKIFDDESIVLTDSTSSADIEDWDSLAQINIITSVQEKFGAKFNILELNAVKNVGELADMVLQKVNA